uniref:Uncharacterized protein LOC114340851 n=1 Tax=Diabrotica virgifera virgifera TaxID=50390 RepID=A0A6P7GUB5_DIAVI
MPQLPNETRWKSHEACLATFISNYYIYVEIRTEKEQEFDKNISKILDNVAIYREALYLQKQLAVIVKALDRFQSDSVNISDAVEIWKDALDHDLLQSYRQEIKKRYDFAIQPFHLFANTMDPKYMGRRLTGEEEETVEQWVASNLSDEFLAVMLSFKIKDTDMFPATLFKEELAKKFSTKKWCKLISIKNKK